MATELRFTISTAAPPARVFAAITEAAHLAHWFCDAAESEAEQGGRLRMRWNRSGAEQHPYEARWVAFEPRSKAAFRGGHAGYPHGDAGLIEFTLAADGPMTALHVRHAIPDGDEYIPVAKTFAEAWPRALERLAGYLTPNT